MKRPLIAAAALSLALAGCGSTIDPKSPEKLIADYLKQSSQITLQSVSCPSGIKPKDGASFECKITIREKGTGKVHRGTIRVHITGGGKKIEILGQQDVQIS